MGTLPPGPNSVNLVDYIRSGFISSEPLFRRYAAEYGPTFRLRSPRWRWRAGGFRRRRAGEVAGSRRELAGHCAEPRGGQRLAGRAERWTWRLERAEGWIERIDRLDRMITRAGRRVPS
jgi:hypothetical protein